MRGVGAIALFSACTGGVALPVSAIVVPDGPAADAVPAPALEPGGYRLLITSEVSVGDGPRLDLEPGGAFNGHPYGTLWTCTGTLSPDELVALTNALDRAGVLTRGDHREPCGGGPVLHFEIQATSGAAAGLGNGFRYEDCFDPVPELDDVLALAFARPTALFNAGGCTGCPTETRFDPCYGEAYGISSFCRGGSREDCPPVRAGAIIDCGSESFSCDASLGWVPAATCTVAEARLWRTVDPDGGGGVRLELVLDVDNPGDTTVDLSSMRKFEKFENQDGVEVPLAGCEGHECVGSVTSLSAAPHTHARYELSESDGTDIGPIFSATAVRMYLRARPWDGAPFAPSVDVLLEPGSAP